LDLDPFNSYCDTEKHDTRPRIFRRILEEIGIHIREIDTGQPKTFYVFLRCITSFSQQLTRSRFPFPRLWFVELSQQEIFQLRLT